jgi:hypothetical protein
MQRRATPPAGTSWVGGAAQRDVLAQATHQRILLGRRSKLFDSGNPRIYTEQALLRALRQGSKDLGDRLLASRAKAGPAHHADPHPVDPGYGRECGDEVGLHRPLGPLAVAFPNSAHRFLWARSRAIVEESMA